jgi:RimJ/RimL family protein N-acetyltransferase
LPLLPTELADDLVLLRPYQGDDLDPMFEAARESIAEVGRWLPWCHQDYSPVETAAWIDSRPNAWETGLEYSFAIVARETGRFVGGCGLNQFDYDRRRANLGYWVRTSACRHGYATAATRLLARFGLSQLGLQRIEIVAALGNVASQRVAAKVGAQREGVARCRLRIRDVPHDAVVFSLVAADFAGPAGRW